MGSTNSAGRRYFVVTANLGRQKDVKAYGMALDIHAHTLVTRMAPGQAGKHTPT